MKTIKLLDCTLRDGGYYNHWDFDQLTVDNYLKAISQANIDIVEIGFRFFEKKEFYGPYAYSTDSFIKTLNIPTKLEIAVMLNFSDIINSSLSCESAIDLLFSEKKESPVSLVRIAAHVGKVKETKNTITYLKKLGYKIGLNIMQANSCSLNELKEIALDINLWGLVDVLYFADSMGNMHEKEVVAIVDTLKTEWNGPIGFHAHNNMGQAEANAIKAFLSGVDWIDATILGMGRGAGNLKMESLLLRLQQFNSKYVPEALFEIVSEEFTTLNKKYEWGENVFYYLSALYNIHPTYVQEMQINKGYSTIDKVGVLKNLHKIGGNSYSKITLNQAIIANTTISEGAWDSTDWTKDKNVLLIANGPSLRKHINGIKLFIEQMKPLVISLNYIDELDGSYVDVYATCHLTKLLSQIDKLKRVEKPIMLPKNALPVNLKQILSNNTIYDYGMFVKKNVLEAHVSQCTIPSPLVFSYVLCSLAMTKSQKIYMVGFDGYAIGDYRNEEMEEAITFFKDIAPNKELIALTPSIFNIEKNSLYNPYV